MKKAAFGQLFFIYKFTELTELTEFGRVATNDFSRVVYGTVRV